MSSEGDAESGEKIRRTFLMLFAAGMSFSAAGHIVASEFSGQMAVSGRISYALGLLLFGLAAVVVIVEAARGRVRSNV